MEGEVGGKDPQSKSMLQHSAHVIEVQPRSQAWMETWKYQGKEMIGGKEGCYWCEKYKFHRCRTCIESFRGVI
jgi:hypothetical protein